MKRHEIRAFLATKGIYISTGIISNRSLDFLLLYKQLHKSMRKELKALIESKGCMILHMDGTHRAGGRVVFVLQEGLYNIVLDADLIHSEAEEYVSPLLSNFKENYGSPLVVVRDMAKGLALSSSKIFPNIPQQICQVHFIRNLESELITEYHKKIQKKKERGGLFPLLTAAFYDKEYRSAIRSSGPLRHFKVCQNIIFKL